ncbi:hypothetical protein [Adhaeretor mobilis]|uniref:Uncharacterized protein n=1 Tax=Adhaeretor mobilis TaxID=1930276 RepID=A0A517MVP6_9BACT|nr:hypothetical protein [Adhaeretor mobilis]QDS98952.1 hypothetical protein HG15A2_22400 [Adhaeretor mobilis]
MPNRIEVPDELQSLIEKREGDERRNETEQTSNAPKEDRREGKDRRSESE